MDRITAEHLVDVPALTLHNPWPVAILYAGKDVENRGWPPPRKVRRLLIHAGKATDRSGTLALRLRGWPEAAIDKATVPAAIVGLVDVWQFCGAGVEGGRCTCATWAMPGKYHWRLSNVLPLPEPVPCKGRQGLWRPDGETVERVLASLDLYAYGPLVCNGRRWEARTAAPLSGECGVTMKPEPEETQAAMDLRARVGGWRLGPSVPEERRHVMCPRCGKAES